MHFVHVTNHEHKNVIPVGILQVYAPSGPLYLGQEGPETTLPLLSESLVRKPRPLPVTRVYLYGVMYKTPTYLLQLFNVV